MVRRSLVLMLALLATASAVEAKEGAVTAASSCGHNQTAAPSYEVLKASADSKKELGTAIFLVPAPDMGSLTDRPVVASNLTYDETVLRGQRATAFRWIAHKELSEQSVRQERAARDCSDYYCGPDHDWCPSLCICGSGNYCR